MATYNISRYKANGMLDGGYKALVRTLDFVIDMSKDVTMTTATDVINIARLPAGAVVVAATVQQVVPGTGTGTLEARVGTTSVSGTLGSAIAAGTISGSLPSALPIVVPVAGAELNLLGATAVRTTGTIRVSVVIVEADREPRAPAIASRDTSL